MEQQSALLSCWLHGSPIADLSALLEQTPDQIESHLRAELHKVRAEATAGPVLVAPSAASPVSNTPANGRDVQAPRRGIRKVPPGAPKTSRDGLVKAAVRAGDPALSGYPSMMRMENQDTMRKVYEILKTGPKTLDAIKDALGVTYDAAWLACKRMLQAGLVQRTEDSPYRWTLLQRPADAATGD